MTRLRPSLFDNLLGEECDAAIVRRPSPGLFTGGPDFGNACVENEAQNSSGA
jgi:hypothetical protein